MLVGLLSLPFLTCLLFLAMIARSSTFSVQPQYVLRFSFFHFLPSHAFSSTLGRLIEGSWNKRDLEKPLESKWGLMGVVGKWPKIS